MKGKMSQYNTHCTILSLLTSPFPSFEPEVFQSLCPLTSLCKAPNFLGSTPELLPDSEYKQIEGLALLPQEDTILKVIYCYIQHRILNSALQVPDAFLINGSYTGSESFVVH